MSSITRKSDDLKTKIGTRDSDNADLKSIRHAPIMHKFPIGFLIYKILFRG